MIGILSGSAHIQQIMNEEKYLVIDGIQVFADEPFLLIYQPREEEPPQYERTPKIQYGFSDNFLLGKAADDIQPIDHMMLRYGSVSSLRDFHLFGPPTLNVNQAAESQICCHGPKKTIYPNQFIEFCYDSQKQS